VPAADPGAEPLGAPVDESDRPPPKASAGGIPSEGSGWGDAIGESFGAGGLGLAGVGEGGGGRSEGIGLGSIGTLGHGAGTSGSHSAAPGQALPGGVRAGEWDDNANFREFARWLGKTDAPGATQLDLSVRRFVVVRDADGKPVPSCLVDVADAAGGSPALTLTTTSNGRALLFPRAEGLRAATLVATARCQGVVALKQVKVGVGDGVVDLQLPVSRVLPEAPSIDVAFVVDTTGSMAEEIDALRGALAKVSGALAEVGVRPRVGLVEYKDKGDEYITRLHPMTTDLPGLSARIDGIRAAGGGDGPEHVNQALRTAIRGLKFRPESVARLVFLVGDAPPHLDYEGDEGYFPAVREASRAGIQIHTIAASGMDHLGQVVFRQVAQYTGASNLFVLRGGAGPQSVGGGDPETSCGGSRSDYQSGNLDALILRKIRAAIGALGRDPLRIAGLHRDEQELPCDQRVSSQ
jgi:Mg-chelatase subunit ChlD